MGGSDEGEGRREACAPASNPRESESVVSTCPISGFVALSLATLRRRDRHCSRRHASPSLAPCIISIPLKLTPTLLVAAAGGQSPGPRGMSSKSFTLIGLRARPSVSLPASDPFPLPTFLCHIRMCHLAPSPTPSLPSPHLRKPSFLLFSPGSSLLLPRPSPSFRLHASLSPPPVPSPPSPHCRVPPILPLLPLRPHLSSKLFPLFPSRAHTSSLLIDPDTSPSKASGQVERLPFQFRQPPAPFPTGSILLRPSFPSHQRPYTPPGRAHQCIGPRGHGLEGEGGGLARGGGGRGGGQAEEASRGILRPWGATFAPPFRPWPSSTLFSFLLLPSPPPFHGREEGRVQGGEKGGREEGGEVLTVVRGLWNGQGGE